jgi:hypothetical protein
MSQQVTPLKPRDDDSTTPYVGLQAFFSGGRIGQSGDRFQEQYKALRHSRSRLAQRVDPVLTRDRLTLRAGRLVWDRTALVRRSEKVGNYLVSER